MSRYRISSDAAKAAGDEQRDKEPEFQNDVTLEVIAGREFGVAFVLGKRLPQSQEVLERY